MALTKTKINAQGDAAKWPRFMPFSALIFISLTSPINVAQAQTNKHSCTIVIDGNPGRLQQSATIKELSSSINGGEPARATITVTNSSFRAMIDKPTGFTDFPNGGNNDTEFSATFSSTGATSFFETEDGIEQKMKKGVSELEINMSAKRRSGAFPAGNYAANVTLRCE